jgi:gamma-glutamyl-gamma-aminobutyrate hydrolase PuuD
MIAGALMGGSYLHLFSENVRGIHSPRDLKGVELLVLWGGADISTTFYKQAKGMSDSSELMTSRDRGEKILAMAAINEGIPILGICRGAQLLCALGGGKLYQDVGNHGHGYHELHIKGDTRKYVTNSCHHQMMIPTSDMEVLGWSPCLSPVKHGNGSTDPIMDNNNEPEIVYFPKMKALGVQGHPEWLNRGDDLVCITQRLCEELLNAKL